MQFFTSVYGNRYVPFLRVFLQSITNIHPVTDVVVTWSDIDQLEIDLLSGHFPNVHFEHVDMGLSDIANIHQRIPAKLRYWQAFMNSLKEGTEVAFLDVDTMIIKDISDLLPSESDVVFTWKVERFPLNTGVLLVRNKPSTRAFMAAWLQRTESVIRDPKKLAHAKETYGAADQLALAELLPNKDFTSPSERDFGGERVRFYPLPCELLNQTNCEPITENVHLFHLKSGLHNILLEDASYSKWRTEKQCEELIRYWSNSDIEVTNSSWRSHCISKVNKHVDRFPYSGEDYVERGILNSEMLAIIGFLYEMEIDVVIESGRYLGQSTKILAQAMEGSKCLVHSTELIKDDIADEAEKRLAGHKNVHLHYGDAAHVIPEIIESYQGKRIAILLDGPKGPAAFDIFSRMIAQHEEVVIGFIHDLRKSYPGMLNPNRIYVHEWFERIFFTDDEQYVQKFGRLDSNCRKAGQWEPYHFAWRRIGSYGPTLGCILPTARDRYRAIQRLSFSAAKLQTVESEPEAKPKIVNPLKIFHRLPGYSPTKAYLKAKLGGNANNLNKTSEVADRRFSDEGNQAAIGMLGDNLEVNPEDIIIDCGANVGQVVEKFIDTGAMIYAFEPNPYAFARLSERFKDISTVVCFPMAVLDQECTVRLFLHEFSEQDQVKWSVGSSIIMEKVNVDKNRFIDVPAVDLSEFVYRLAKRVKLLKMDIEGAEYRTLTKLIERDLVKNIDHVLVETHKNKIPELQSDHTALENLIAEKQIKNINLEWI